MKILIATIGSLGDLHPYMALATGLQRRGHAPMIAAPALYRDRIESAGLPFAPLGPEDMNLNPAAYARILDSLRGVEFLMRDILMPTVKGTYAELDRIVSETRPDLLVTNPVVFAGPLLSEKTGIPWVSTVVAPLSLFSAYDTSELPGVPSAIARGPDFLTPWWGQSVQGIGRFVTRRWCQPVEDLRRELSLPPSAASPMYDGQHSPRMVLAMFSRLLGAPQPDWPRQTVQSGFCFHDEPQALDPELEKFLDAGDPPIVFTLGSTAVNAAGDFYRESAAAARALGRRALLLVGNNVIENAPGVFPYAPHAAVFPRASAIVHQGGVGTTAQALRSGVPSLIVPFNFDQPDNGARVARLGAARVLRRSRYSAANAARELEKLVAAIPKAREIASELAREDGVESACKALESLK